MVKITKKGIKGLDFAMIELVDIMSDPHGKFRRGTTPKKIYWSVNSLQRGGYIEKSIHGKHKIIKITNKGKLIALREKINQKQNNKQWDRKWRIVIFDIPENDRKERNFLRSYLKSFGLKELQKSVWVYPYDIEKEFYEFLRLCNKTFEGDIRFITIEKMNRDSDLKKYFKIH